MTHAEFIKQVDLLIETYGEKAYPPQRVTRIYGWARRVNAKTFAQAVDAAIADCAHAPLLSKLREFYSEIRAKNPEREKIACDYCDGGGFILSEGVMPLAYACNCEAGQQVPDFVPRWTGLFKRIIPRAGELMRVKSNEVVNSTMKGMK